MASSVLQSTATSSQSHAPLFKLQDTLKDSIATKRGTRVLMEQFVLRSSEAKFVGEIKLSLSNGYSKKR